jgi:hypothetical protein
MSKDSKYCGKVTADVIETGAILLVDQDGRIRAQLMCNSDERESNGFVVIHLYDGNGRPRLSLQVSDNEGPSVALFNGKASPCVSLAVFEDRANGITVCDGEGIPRFSAGTTVDNLTSAREQSVKLELRDSEGQIIWSQPERPTEIR